MEIAEIVKRKNAAQKYVHDNLDRKEIIMQSCRSHASNTSVL